LNPFILSLSGVFVERFYIYAFKVFICYSKENIDCLLFYASVLNAATLVCILFCNYYKNLALTLHYNPH